MLKGVELSEDEEKVGYDVESLVTNIRINETILFVMKFIFIKNFNQFANNLPLRNLLKLTTQCIFSINEELCKQIDRVSMGGALSVVLSDFSMNKMEKDVAIPF